MDEIGHRLCEFLAHRLAFIVTACAGKCRLDRVHGVGQDRLVGDHRLMRHTLELARNLDQRHLGVRRGHCQRLCLFDQSRLDGHRRGRCRRIQCAKLGRPVRAAAGHRAQQARSGVESEQRLGHRRLHAEHVDQEAERAQVAGQTIDSLWVGGVTGRRRQRIDIVAHPDHRMRCLIQAKYRQHATHGVELAGDAVQLFAHRRRAEKGVDGLLGLGQGTAQLLDDTAHGLPVRHAAVEFLHPGLERLGLGAIAHVEDALREAAQARGL